MFIIFKQYSKINKDIDNEQTKQYLYHSYLKRYNYMKEIITFKDVKRSIKELLKMFIIMKIINIINDKLLLLIVVNIIIFYSPLENKSDHFLFKGKMAVKQFCEGIVGLIECLIPRYEAPKENI